MSRSSSDCHRAAQRSCNFHWERFNDFNRALHTCVNLTSIFYSVWCIRTKLHSTGLLPFCFSKVECPSKNTPTLFQHRRFDLTIAVKECNQMRVSAAVIIIVSVVAHAPFNGLPLQNFKCWRFESGTDNLYVMYDQISWFLRWIWIRRTGVRRWYCCTFSLKWPNYRSSWRLT